MTIFDQATLFDVAAGAAGGWVGYAYGNSLIPGLGGYWGFAFGSVVVGGLMMVFMGTDMGKKWVQNVEHALHLMVKTPALAVMQWLFAMFLLDTAWDYAFELFDPFFDFVFEILPGGYTLWQDFNPYGKGYLQTSAIIALLITIGFYNLIGWPLSCFFWMICRLIGGDKGECDGKVPQSSVGFPCPSGWFDYQCPNTFKNYWRGDANRYGLYELFGDIVHMVLIPFAVPLCLFFQAVNGDCQSGKHEAFSVFDILMLPYVIMTQYIATSGTIFLDIGYLVHSVSIKDITHIFTHLFDELKCDSWQLKYC